MTVINSLGQEFIEIRPDKMPPIHYEDFQKAIQYAREFDEEYYELVAKGIIDIEKYQRNRYLYCLMQLKYI